MPANAGTYICVPIINKHSNLDSSNGSDATYSRSVKRPKDVVMTKCECVARGGAKIDNDPDPASRIKSTASANDA